MAVARAARLALAATSAAAAAGRLGPVTAAGFGSHIEGASVDASGNLYATHFRNTADDSFGGNQDGRNVIGKVDAVTGEASAFFEGEAGAEFNGMRWAADGASLLLADVRQGKVVRVDLATMAGEDYCGGAGSALDGTGAPNDMALAKSGLLFLSGQQWEDSTGGLWLCRPDASGRGQLLALEGDMARTNGIALSPDDKTLYLTEAVGSPVPDAYSPFGQRIWRYDVAADGSVSGKTEFFNFATGTATPEANADSDGMRTDTAGNLYVTRNGKGKVTVISPAGDLVAELQLSSIVHATNLAFGGKDGKTLYVVGRCGHAGWGSGDGCLEAVAADEPGREWTWLRSSSPPTAPPAATTLSSTPAPPTAEPPCATKAPPATPAPSTAAPSTSAPSTTAATTTPSPTTAAGDDGACSGEWQQCGGQDWSGPLCCKHGLACQKQSIYYSQCLRPGALMQQAQQRKVQSHEFLASERAIGRAPMLLQSSGTLQRFGKAGAEL